MRTRFKSNEGTEELRIDPNANLMTIEHIISAAFENSRSTNTNDEAERFQGNIDLFEYLRPHLLTMTPASMQLWNGNCWYGAIAFHLNRDSPDTVETATTIRRHVLDYVKANSQRFLMSYGSDSNFEPQGLSKTAQFNYDVQYLSKSTNWSTRSSMSEIVLSAACELFDMSMTVYQANKTTTS